MLSAKKWLTAHCVRFSLVGVSLPRTASLETKRRCGSRPEGKVCPGTPRRPLADTLVAILQVVRSPRMGAVDRWKGRELEEEIARCVRNA
eukprot:COSAG01_NODE_796_length_13536_cov_5.683635_17_plen_90_part_00